MVNSAIGYPRASLPGPTVAAGVGVRNPPLKVKSGAPALLSAVSGGISVLSQLVAAAPDAVALTAVSGEGLAAATARLDEAARRWLAAIAFTAEPGKSALVPDA